MSASAESPGYFAFISYSHQDELWASWLHKALETYRVPSRLVGQATAAGVIPRRIAPIFRDRDELASATDLSRKVNAALAQSRNLIVICSPQSAASRWVNEEILAFKRLGRSERIFCLIVGGEPNASDLPGRAAEECFAPALRFELGADGELTTKRTEPIAADARDGKDGKANAKLKLIAGLLDVGFDALKQRELQRRNRRLAIVTAAALLIMAVTTTLAITAVIARDDAERRQKQAEELVNFMLGDLNDKLGEVKRLDILQAVDDKAMAYFASLPVKDVTDAVLGQRVTALEKIGSVRLDQGQIPSALEAYANASAIAAALASRQPSDVSRQAAYADSLKWVGTAYWFKGDLEQAQEKFIAASKILQRAVASKPGDVDLAFSLAAARNNAGHVLEARGNLAATRTEYDATLSIYEDLLKREPANSRWQNLVGDAYNNLGKLAVEEGHLDRAIRNYRADQRIKSALASADPNNHDAEENLLRSNAILGRSLGIAGAADPGIHYLSAAVASAKRLVAFDPANTSWQEYHGLYSMQLAGLLRQQQHIDAAAAAADDAVRALQALATNDPSNDDWQLELAQSELERARDHLAVGAIGLAAQLVDTARAAGEKLRVKSPDSRTTLLLVAQTEILSGQLATARGDSGSAHERWTRARATLLPLMPAEQDPNYLATWATALLLLDDIDGARPTLERLASMGYRTSDLSALAKGRFDYSPDAETARRISEVMESAD